LIRRSGAVVHLGHSLTGEHETDVLDLAGGGADGRRDVLGPAPARLVGRPAEDRRPVLGRRRNARSRSGASRWVRRSSITAGSPDICLSSRYSRVLDVGGGLMPRLGFAQSGRTRTCGHRQPRPAPPRRQRVAAAGGSNGLAARAPAGTMIQVPRARYSTSSPTNATSRATQPAHAARRSSRRVIELAGIPTTNWLGEVFEPPERQMLGVNLSELRASPKDRQAEKLCELLVFRNPTSGVCRRSSSRRRTRLPFPNSHDRPSRLSARRSSRPKYPESAIRVSGTYRPAGAGTADSSALRASAQAQDD
jgi:hypothetical protein